MKISNYRWRVVALLFCATTINYIDRQVLALLKPYLSDDLGITEADYGMIVSSFQIAYAVCMLFAGKFIDKYGSRIAYAFFITVWSLAGCLHAAAVGVYSLASARFMLGVGESGNFPTAIKTIAEWFPKKDRAFATGIFNSGSNIGAIVAPPLLAFLALGYGWRMAFIVTGAIGLIWVVFWLWLYQTPEKTKGISQAELDYIKQDDAADISGTNPDGSSLPLREGQGDSVSLLKNPAGIGLSLCRALCDWPWWFFLFWAPDYLKKTYSLDLSATVVPLMVIYIVADVGSIFGGWLSRTMISHGRSVRFARAASLLICACLVLPVSLLPGCSELNVAVGIIALACFAHQAWASNIYTVASDYYEKENVGTITSIVGFCGALVGSFASFFVGLVLETTGSYQLIFLIASSAYLVAWIVLQMFLRKSNMV